MPFRDFSSQLQSSTNELIHHLAQGCQNGFGLGSMSTCAYDTAWVAMVRKTVNGRDEYLFSASFDYLVESQATVGGWGLDSSQVDAILNTLAAILAMKKHRNSYAQNQDRTKDLESRIIRATSFVQERLEKWDVETTDHVGFEILVPKHLALLANEGIKFEFPGFQALMNLNKKKLAKFRPEILYSQHPTTLIHSLEAFAEEIDFDRVKHHLCFGSMMGSPSSTAAYLMYASEWDDSAEAYICSAIEHGEGHKSGAVPSAFPITIFELTWAISTLIGNGITLGGSNSPDLEIIASYLEHHFNLQQGTVGFVPGLLVDADDTAKTITSLNLLNKQTSPEGMLKAFKNGDHFYTYIGERNPSFSANCNILSSLLNISEPEKFVPEIEVALKFLLRLYFAGDLKDKWNTSQLYPNMLFSHALRELIELSAAGRLGGIPEELLRQSHLVFLDILIRILQSQCDDGSWSDSSPEISAYACLTLASGSNSPLAGVLGSRLVTCLDQGQDFLRSNTASWDHGATIWIEKVSYSSSILCKAYCMAAVAVPTFQNTVSIKNMVREPPKAICKFFSRLPLFAKEQPWRLEASLAQGYLWLPRLAAQRHLVFPRDGMEEDKYLEYIPQTWTTCNNLNDGPMEAELLWDMMVISMLNYQADEFLEAVVGEHMMDQLSSVRSIVYKLCGEPSSKRLHSSLENGVDSASTSVPTKKPAPLNGSKPTLEYVEAVLQNFTSYVLTHPSVRQSPPAVQAALRQELQTFILAHLNHAEDNARFAAQDLAPDATTPFATPRSSYHAWVRSTSADHTSCPYSFRFLGCLVACPGRAPFEGARQLYLAEDMCRHLATLCRQYNDYGSIVRDRAERNLNSVNFPEFDGGSEQKRKDDLMWLAEYEREMCVRALERLTTEMGLDARMKRILRTFVDVTDLYGQIYVARDIASRMK